MNELALFAGAGGGILGGKLLRWRTVCAVEIDPYARQVLLARQADGTLEKFPIWDDIRTFTGSPWAGAVDIITGGFPCQDISPAGKGAGITGEKSGLWSEMFRIIGEIRPRFALIENSPTLTFRGLDRVLSDLAEIRYDAEWIVLGADDLGAPHIRKRIWILARRNYDFSHAELLRPGRRIKRAKSPEEKSHDGDTDRNREPISPVDAETPRLPELVHTESTRFPQPGRTIGKQTAHARPADPSWWTAEPGMGRVAHGLAHRVDRIRCLGNGQVPIVAATAFLILLQRFEEEEN